MMETRKFNLVGQVFLCEWGCVGFRSSLRTLPHRVMCETWCCFDLTFGSLVQIHPCVLTSDLPRCSGGGPAGPLQESTRRIRHKQGLAKFAPRSLKKTLLHTKKSSYENKTSYLGNSYLHNRYKYNLRELNNWLIRKKGSREMVRLGSCIPTGTSNPQDRRCTSELDVKKLFLRGEMDWEIYM